MRARELKAYEDYILEVHNKWVTEGHAHFLARDGRRYDPSFCMTANEIIYEMTIKGVKEERARINYKYDCLSGACHYWVGINPPTSSHTLLELYSKMEKCVKRYKLFKKGYIYCLENYTEHGQRPHIHMMLLDTSTKPSRIIETLAKVFACDKNFIQCKKFTDGILYSEHHSYIKGDKTSSKIDFVKNDLKILSEYNIPKYLGTI